MELTLAILDNATGQLIVEDETDIGRAAQALLRGSLGDADAFGCAKPSVDVLMPETRQSGPAARIRGIWHDSHVEGPGRRSVVQFQGCPIRCIGCWVPETHDADAGQDVSVDDIADALLDGAHQRDGVTILGGEAFAQPLALLALIVELRDRQPDVHITVYSGFTLEALRHRDYTEVILSGIDVLLDGPYVKSRAHSADCGCSDETLRFTGSCNQRVLTRGNDF